MSDNLDNLDNLDNWDNWDNLDNLDNYIVPVLHEQQIKILKERKLVEESDNALTKDLFSNDENKIIQDSKKINQPLQNIQNAQKVKLVSNQHQNKLKQRDISRIIKEHKIIKERERELYGENEYFDEYAYYEKKFN